jgi:ribosomal protein S12 methylthiotransferase accessory factor
VIRSPLPLPEAAQAYVDSLPEGQWWFFDQAPIDRTGVPAFVAAYMPDDAQAACTDLQINTGYGISPEQAMIGAAAEVYEYVGARLFLRGRPVVRGSHDDLVRERGAASVLDPLTLCLPAGSPVGRDTPLAWTEGYRHGTDEPVLVPLDLVALSPDELPAGYSPFTTLITNGQGAGPNRDWAFSHGLFELLQRDGNGLRFRALDQGVALDLETAPSDVREIYEGLRAKALEVTVKLATTEFGTANVYVVGSDADPGDAPVPIALTATGEGCDLDAARAVRKALLEYAHARARKAVSHGTLEEVMPILPDGYWDAVAPSIERAAQDAEPRQVEAFNAWLSMSARELKALLHDPLYTVRKTVPFGDLPRSDIETPEARGLEMARRLTAEGMTPVLVDLTPEGLPMSCVRVVTPGLEVETMSYHRIGERGVRKLMERDSPLIRSGEPTEARRPVRLPPEAYDRLGGVPLLDVEAVDRTVGRLYPLYREPSEHQMIFRRNG